MQKDNIDDKLFDVLLKTAATEALKQEMNEMTSCDESNELYKPSPELEKEIRKMISRHEFKKRAFMWRKTTMKVVSFVVLAIIISSTVLFSVEATRNYIFNAVIKWNNDNFSIEYSDDVDKTLTVYEPTYSPKGFKEVSSSSIGKITEIIYQNELGTEILLMQSPAKSSKILADHEDKKVVTIEINGQEAYLVEAMESGKTNSVLWEYNGVLFNISSEIESTELILIAESIKK